MAITVEKALLWNEDRSLVSRMVYLVNTFQKGYLTDVAYDVEQITKEPNRDYYWAIRKNGTHLVRTLDQARGMDRQMRRNDMEPIWFKLNPSLNIIDQVEL